MKFRGADRGVAHLATVLLSLAVPLSGLADAGAWLPLASSPESVGFSSRGLEDLDAAMRKAVADGKVAGVSTVLIRHGQEVAFRAHGVSNLETREPLRRDTIFRIASMTKPITSVAMMMLFEEGKWRLDDPVTNLVPELGGLQVIVGRDDSGKTLLAPAKRIPTMRELMSHTAGFGNDASVLGAVGLQQMIERIAALPLAYEPGERWSYSLAVDIQSYIVERLSGQSFNQFLKQRIFEPLKMTDTGFSVSAERIEGLAVAYVADPARGTLAPVTHVSDTDRMRRPTGDWTQPATTESGGGGLVSTIDDYARFAQMLANGGELDGARILSRRSVELMRTNVVAEAAIVEPTPFFDEGEGFGLGVRLVTDRAESPAGAGTMSWEGATGTFFWVDPMNDLVFVGMLQAPGQFAPRDDARALVYAALIDPAK
jgi:CubicO group peptidase (beta-lactamase class C family)